MDKFIFVHKNWPFDSWVGYLKPTDFVTTYKVESKVMAKLEVEFENEVEGEDFFDLSKSIKSPISHVWRC
jgi:hypothetical protein